MNKSNLQDKILSGERITREEALSLFNWDIPELGSCGDARRRMNHDTEDVGFIIDRIINFTNICEASCDFCAYHQKAGEIDGYELNSEEILEKVDSLVRSGGSQIMLQGGLHKDYSIERYVDIIRTVKQKYPSIYLHSLSPAEIIHITRKSKMSLKDVIITLKRAGLDSVPGASDLLVDRIRNHVSPKKCTRDQWRSVIDALAEEGMKSSATMTYGMGETLEERIEHLDVIRSAQDSAGNIMAFIPWSFSPRNTALSDITPATGHDYMKIVAIGRIYLDNITYIQAGWLTEGIKLAQIALSMGANDMGGILMEEVVVRATGITREASIEEFMKVISKAGKNPVLRDSQYKVLKRY